ncbi:cell wall-associated hydrolase, invasion-associated protein [Desulfitobacterium dichloroeliminans LMG P-21439]|uniref:Cell wall-associated hydrolase, invasion-associated protein n=1 Tax=Desulfitobacterium dichloroeliminans (strain LMG P-21439 / DCA1) TaxID=871963 RepID=L0F6R6_DESDL|nr:C40 family peptidase [Desulfitobacterium dichloroeliminans]AGA68648.1 cell wall-associated hydrolase, invasion-associated protein [Desulfitobacterium dichloroeliminans LMG P-21439]
MNIPYPKKWFGVAVISGIVLATSLFNAIPAQAWKNPVSRIVPTNISLEQDKILNPIVKEELNMIALDARVETESLKKEVFLEKKWLRQSKRDKSIEASQSSLKSTEIKLSTINTEEVKKEVSTAPAPTRSKPAPAKAKPTPAQPQKQTAQKSSPPAVSRGAGEIEQLLNRANGLIGVPYLWGGTTPKGFDCSGFVGYVFKASGISLPRTSFDMYKVGTPVERNQLKPGDLVFFSTYQKGASDVRIYIGGNQTIGASSGGVDIRSLSESYWDKHYYGARRVL